jgi:hypothetical protein
MSLHSPAGGHASPSICRVKKPDHGSPLGLRKGRWMGEPVSAKKTPHCRKTAMLPDNNFVHLPSKQLAPFKLISIHFIFNQPK